jgi:type IX secretion system PorP/SprF family membrane protein
MSKHSAMKNIITILFLVIFTYSAQAQQDAMYTHYMFNTLAINPAYAGSRDALSITGLHRSQWIGFDGAPTTQTLTLHSPIASKNIGIGLSVINDKIGPTRTTSLYFDFSYKINFSKNSHLAFGLKGGMNVRKQGFEDLNIVDQNDPLVLNDIRSQLLPNFGFGMYYFGNRFYTGLSIPKLLENNYETNTTEGTTNLASEMRHYYLIAGAVFDLSSDIKLKPTTFIKVTNGAPIEADVTASFIFRDRFWLGAMFRTGDALGLLAGVNITDQFALGYSFDWSYANKTVQYNVGSHELMLRYDLVFKVKDEDVLSPRYF